MVDVFFPETKENQQQQDEQPTIIKIIGVGGGGANAVNRMIVSNVTNVEFYAVNTDLPTLRKSGAENKIQLGDDGLGVGGDPLIAQKYAEADEEKLKDMVSGANMVFITTGMGGGTGTGAAPVIAKISKELGILTVGVVTKPFEMEGPDRALNANKGIAKLKEYTDALIIIPNDRIFSLIDEKTPYEKAFETIDDVLRRSIESITDTITKTGIINIDFADVKGVLSNSDSAIIGLGDGQDFKDAFEKALTNKFVEGGEITEASKILINVSYSQNNEFTVEDVRVAGEYVKTKCKARPYLKIGNVRDNNLNTKIKVSIIASFKKKEEPAKDLWESAQNEQLKEQSLESETNNDDTKENIDDVFAKPAWQTHKPKRL